MQYIWNAWRLTKRGKRFQHCTACPKTADRSEKRKWQLSNCNLDYKQTRHESKMYRLVSKRGKIKIYGATSFLIGIKQTYNVNIMAPSHNHTCRGKEISTAYCVCVCVALATPHAKRLRRIILPSMASLTPPYFPHYLVNAAIFGKNLLNIKHVFWVSLKPLSKTFLIIRRTLRDTVINVKSFHV
jgi:hypothetical protein